jgi:hypothetical protein
MWDRGLPYSVARGNRLTTLISRDRLDPFFLLPDDAGAVVEGVVCVLEGPGWYRSTMLVLVGVRV